MSDIAEKDWKLLRRLQPVLLERFCEEILAQAVDIAESTNDTNHERYLKLYRFLKEKDREMAYAFDDYRRSNARLKIHSLYACGIITDEEVQEFSEEIRYMIRMMNSPG